MLTSVYDCRIKPSKTDKTSFGRALYITYKDYIDRWSEIHEIFSKEAIYKGSFDKYATTNLGKKGSQEVDNDFLKEIETWRKKLAGNIALRNVINEAELRYSVQQIIDRIIFLRICEDRGTEPYGRLQELQKGDNVYKRLFDLFLHADNRYDSGLFHFKKEDDFPNDLDQITPKLNVDDKILKDLIKSLYYPCPYVFSVIPIEILGKIYEQFLGKSIQLSPSNRVVIEDKPEVKKSGGVFYTPKYIVDYIVENTLADITRNKNPSKLENIKILDPACGSGSFLLSAYDFLLKENLKWYQKNNPDKYSKGKSPKVFKYGNVWRLTINEKKKILVNNIFGVDVDPQAVEVTKLSLLLKVLEEESAESIGRTYDFLQAKLLPNLYNNIKCGNSLMSTDFKEQNNYQNNPFDWKLEFKHVFNKGGFDAVLGNPPYIRIQTLKTMAPCLTQYYKNTYKTAIGNYDIYILFMEKSIDLLNSNGKLGFIVPNKFFLAEYGLGLKKLIEDNKYLSAITNFGDQQVFSNATIYTCLIFLDKKGCEKLKYTSIRDIEKWKISFKSPVETISLKEFIKNNWSVPKNIKVSKKLSNCKIRLDDIADKIFQGLITGKDSVFILSKVDSHRYFSEATGQEYDLEESLLHPLCKGSVNIKRYNFLNVNKVILFPYENNGKNEILLSQKKLSTKYPKIWAYLKSNKKILEDREKGKWKCDKLTCPGIFRPN